MPIVVSAIMFFLGGLLLAVKAQNAMRAELRTAESIYGTGATVLLCVGAYLLFSGLMK